MRLPIPPDDPPGLLGGGVSLGFGFSPDSDFKGAFSGFLVSRDFKRGLGMGRGSLFFFEPSSPPPNLPTSPFNLSPTSDPSFLMFLRRSGGFFLSRSSPLILSSI